MKRRQNFIMGRILLTLLVVVSISGILAAEPLSGSFSLPSDTYWQGRLMPAGHYTFKLDTAGVWLELRHARLGTRYVMFNYSEQCQSPAKSQLVVVNVGNQPTVNVLYLAPVGRTFWFSVPKRYSVSTRIIAEAKPSEELNFVPVTVLDK